MVAGEGFEPSKAEPGDLQSPPIGRSGNPPGFFTACVDYLIKWLARNRNYSGKITGT
jgi:hypothetical protein